MKKLLYRLREMYCFTLAALLLMIIPGIVLGQTTTNPNISVIGDFRMFGHNQKGLPRSDGFNFQLTEIEVAVQAYLNPFARADVFFASHGGEGIEIEEAYATFLRGLPWGMQIKAGKYYVEFGKLNTLHRHAFPFMDRPLSHRVFFGFDGLSELGVHADFLLPTGRFYTKLNLNILQGEFFGRSQAGHVHGQEGDEHVGEEAEGVPEGDVMDNYRGTSDPVLAARLSTFFPMSDNGNIEFGINALTGIYKTENVIYAPPPYALRATMTALDFKYKWRPDKYKSLTIQGEWIINKRKVYRLEEDEISGITNYGAFLFLNYRFSKWWNIGTKYDYAPGVFDYEGGDIDYDGAEVVNTIAGQNDNKNHTMAFSVFFGFSPAEETSIIRLLIMKKKYVIGDPEFLVDHFLTKRNSDWLAVLQLVFSLGPHKAHLF